MSRLAIIFDKASTVFFVLGSITSKMAEGPLPLIGPVLKVFSLLSFLLGYGLWYVSTLIQKGAPPKSDRWYGFAEFKQQFQMAALLGLIATTLCIVLPALIIPVAWMYALSNIIWSIGEYHKKKMPPANDASFSTARQSIFCKYTLAISAVSLLSAAGLTLSTFFPLTAAIVVPVASGLCGAMLIVAMLMMGLYLFGKFTPDQQNVAKPKSSSTSLEFSLETGLAPSQTQNPKADLTKSPTIPQHFPSPTASSATQSSSSSPLPTPSY